MCCLDCLLCRAVVALIDSLMCRCKDKKGTFSVETTAWEGTNGAAVGAAGSATASHQHPGTSVADKTMYSFYQDD